MKNIEDVYPLSGMQQGLLFHALEAAGQGVYVEQLSCRLVGAVEVGAFRAAWEQVTARHGVLRTAFVWEGLSEPLQVVHRRVRLPWVEEDWRGLGPAAQAARWAAYVAADRVGDFALTHAPLMRFALMRDGAETYRFVWTHHHLLLDGWSVPLVLREVFALYGAAVRGEAAGLGPARPYRAYIAWLQGQDAAGAEAYWRRNLAGYAGPVGGGGEPV